MHRRYFFIIAALVFGLSAWSFAQEQQTSDQPSVNHQVGKTGKLKIAAPVKVGDTVLPPGKYYVKHVTTPDRHFVEFVREVEVPSPLRGYRKPSQALPSYKREKVAEVNCTRRPLAEKARKTVAITNDDARITRLEIKGDADAHLF